MFLLVLGILSLRGLVPLSDDHVIMVLCAQGSNSKQCVGGRQ